MSKKELLIEETNKVIAQYSTKLTLRQIYYRLVAQQIIPNTQNQYKYLSKILTEARKQHKVPFSAIEDRQRKPIERWYYFETPEEYMKRILDRAKEDLEEYTINPWHEQDYFIEIWVEKQALEALFDEVARTYRVSLIVCKGYPSVTLLKQSADRIEDEMRRRNVDKIVILYFGDYDSSGKDIPRSINKQLIEDFDVNLELKEVALNLEQIKKLNLPPAPAKKSDSRSQAFIAEHGDMAVELDAVEPNILQDMVVNAILDYWDKDYFVDNVKPEINKGKDFLETEVEERFGDLLEG